MASNSNLPSIKVWINSSYIYKDVSDPKPLEGFLVGIRCLQNQTYQFHVLLRNGAFYVGIAPHMLSFSPTINSYPLSDACVWDAVSSDIEVITYDLLRYMPCTVKLRNNKIIKATYMFTLDCVGDVVKVTANVNPFKDNEGIFLVNQISHTFVGKIPVLYVEGIDSYIQQNEVELYARKFKD